MKLEELAAARRTHKAFGPEPLARETLLELLEVARLAPTHHLNQPWRFRVLGPATLAELKRVAGEKEAGKLDRAPTLVVATAALTGDLAMDEEDVCATAAAIMLVLLAATERGIATYWRTPAGTAHEGRPRSGRDTPRRALPRPAPLRNTRARARPREREPVGRYVEFLP